jgi:hypothetical protein
LRRRISTSKSIINMRYGFIYELFRVLIEGFRFLNLVELFKIIGQKLNPYPNDINIRTTYVRVSVDIFIISKWLLVLTIFFTSSSNLFLCFLVWYLIITNVYTYFYYHVWDSRAINQSENDDHSLRRRFINLLLAISFSNLAFAYLYSNYYSNQFSWGVAGINLMHAIWYSITNSISGNYSLVNPISDLGYSISMLQLVISFVFITIVVSRSIPQKN